MKKKKRRKEITNQELFIQREYKGSIKKKRII